MWQDKPLWRMKLLGGLCAQHGTHTVERFPTQKTAGLLAILAFSPGRRFPRERLVDALWPEADPAAGRDRLSQALVWLRRRLEPDDALRGSVLVADRLSVGLALDAVTTDIAQFESALAVAKTRDDSTGRAALEEAVSFYAGDLLPDVSSEWVPAERQRLLNAYLLALDRLSHIHEEAGDPRGALDYARRALLADPLHEEAHRDLIRLLAATGQTTAALRQFQEFKGLLARELDSEPSAETLALAEQIRRGVLPQQAPSLVPHPPTLPTPLTKFFGRENEIALIKRMVQQDGARLVTLLGTGGAGKTRLGLAVAAALRDRYGGPVAFVPLADLREAKMIPAAIAQALHLHTAVSAISWEHVSEALRERPSLLILDNMEHLLPDAAPLVQTLLEQTPLLTALVTSRQRLGVDGEWEMPVLSLPLPEPAALLEQIGASPSVQLFVDRARAVRPDFALTPANADVIRQVCVRLEGIPLAIELCAAWAQTLTPAQMMTQLARRFELLVSRRADIIPRHRTLRAAVEYSYLMLPPDLKRLFVHLSIFRGGWSLEAAESVCADPAASERLPVIAGLKELRERSLIVAEESGESGAAAQMRYRILDTLREFAAGQMTYADRAERRQRHLSYFLEWAEAGAAGSEQGQWLEQWLARMAHDQENLRAALEWSLEDKDTGRGLRLGIALSRYWSVRGPLSEGYDWMRRLLDRPEPAPDLSTRVRADAWSALGQLAWSQGDYAAAQETHEKALALRRESEDAGDEVAASLYHLGITAYRRDDYAAARDYLEESLALSRARNDRAGIARVLLNLGNIGYEQQNYAQAEEFFQQSLALEQELGKPSACGERLQ